MASKASKKHPCDLPQKEMQINKPSFGKRYDEDHLFGPTWFYGMTRVVNGVHYMFDFAFFPEESRSIIAFNIWSCRKRLDKFIAEKTA